jgi:hypothetical protein
MTIINQITSFKISGFTYNGTDTQLNYTAGVTGGTAQPSKALVLDAGSNINSINTITLTNLNTTTLSVNGTTITSGTLTNLSCLDGAIVGTGVANKVLILDSNRDITNIRNLNATSITGTLQTAAQPNITSLGILSSLALSGALSGVTTIGASGIVSITNTTTSTNTTTGALVVTGGVGIGGAINIGGNLSVAGNIMGTLITSAQPNITSIGTLTSLSLSGAITGITNISAGGNLTLTGHNGLTTGLILNSTLVTATGTELNYLDLTNGPGTGEASKAIILDSNRDIINIRNLTATSLTATNLTGTIQTAAQTNITSVGTLTSLTLSGSLTGVTTFNASGVVSITNTTTATNATTGALVVSGGLGVTGAIYTNNVLVTNNGAIASTTTSGALRSGGGLGVTGSGFFGNTVAAGQTAQTGLTSWLTSGIQFRTGAVSHTTTSTGTLASAVFSSFAQPTLAAATAGTITTEASTVYIDNSPLAGTNMTITNGYALCVNSGRTFLKDGTTSTNTTTGALVVTGGVGIGGAVNIGGSLSVTGSITGTLATASQPNITTLGGVTSIGASNATTITGILQTTAQTNITSVGTLTGLTSSGVVSITNTTASSSTSTGALTVSGGVGITGALNIGNTLSISGNINTPLSIASATKTIGGIYSVDGLIWNTIDDRLFGMRISATDTLALCWAGGGSYSDRILFSNNLTPVGGGAGTQFNTKVYINNTTTSTNTTSGALVIIGGIGIGGATNIGGALSVTGNITGTLATANQSNITSVGTLTGLTSSGVISITNTTASTNTTTGALTVSGGVGISGATNIAGALSVTGNITGTLVTANQTNITSVGTLTGLTSSGIVLITNTTASTNSTTGALVVSGGVGIGGVINTTNTISTTQSVGDGFVHNAIGTNAITLKSNINTANTWAQFGTSSNHELRFMTNSISRLNISNAGAISIPGVVSITNTTTSTNPTSGALVVSGGLGVTGAIYTNNTLATNSGTIASSTTSGALRSAGGLGVTGSGFFGNTVAAGQTAQTGLTSWLTSGIQFRTGGVSHTTTSTGTLASAVFSSFARPTLAAATAGTVTTEASTVYIDNSPLAGTNMTITNTYALWINAGRTILKDTTTSTSTTSGALTIAGGVGIEGAVNIGNTLNIEAPISITPATKSIAGTSVDGVIWHTNQDRRFGMRQIDTNNLALCWFAGGTYNDKIIFNEPSGTTFNMAINITNTTASTSSTTGALRVAGGVGIGGAVNIGTYIKTPYIQVGTSTDTSRLISCLDSITTVNSDRKITLGSSNSSGNQAEINFNYQGSNSNSNRLSLGFHSNTTLLNILNSGDVNIGGITSGCKLIVTRASNNNNFIRWTDGTTIADVFINSSGTPSIGSVSANDFGFYTANGSSNQLYLKQGGNVGIGTNNPTSTLQVNGSLSKNSGTFDIQHPIKANTRLVHSFIEGPRCDLIYRGSIQLINGKAIVNLDTDCVASIQSAMSSGTFEALVQNPVCYLQNSTFDRIIGNINKNILTITCENINANSIVNWMVIGERKDQFIKVWNRTDSEGRLITEY